ncbi:hypothetical protein EYC84_006019 [Monilinia fructicola]|uniref:Uncharacterized protein n=1 Tax=Monilinia fructicola TaxID=38448 RepID=A0A5M9K0Y9_MONFR|nr:hypothetical protein EYC84_006019 [Monilinia fructicola]
MSLLVAWQFFSAPFAIFAVITLVFTLPNSIPSGPSLGKFTDHRMSLPKLPNLKSSPSILNPFRQAAHAPPVQKNSTYGESKWHANWNWLSPFSSSRGKIWELDYFCNYLTLPMGPYEDQTLSFLRRGEYPLLTRYDEMGSGIFSGSKSDITAAVKAALANTKLKDVKDFVGAVPKDTFEIDPSHDSLAFYQTKIVEQKYPQIAKGFEGNGAAGLQLLNKLIISHLHQTWQNIFTEGISVVKPEPEHMSYLIEPALQLAEYLAQCPDSPMPASCPPNRPKCKPCVASSPMKISTPAFYRNTSGLYTIGTVPHPYTMSTLSSFQEKIDIRWIRRESPRDAWLSTLTKELLGTGVSGTPRIIKFKEAVASPHGTSHSLWLTAEKEIPSDLDWHFGFTIPRNATDTGKSETPVPGPERRPKPVHDPKDGPVPTEEDKKKEEILLAKAKTFGGSDKTEDLKIRGAVEAWNLADTEAWRFARHFWQGVESSV